MPTSILWDKNQHTALTIDDRIFLGEGLFETLRVEQQCPCYSELHWNRMRDNANVLGISFDVTFEKWHATLKQSLQETGLQKGGIKVLLSGGRAPRGLVARGKVSYLSLQPFQYNASANWLRLVSADWLRDAKNPLYRLKSVNYLEAIIARRQALNLGADDMLFFNTQHGATETTVANLFIIKEGQLLTPALAEGVLPGIIRNRLLKLCKEANLGCGETTINKQMLAEADAIFTTNSLQGIQNVKSVDEIEKYEQELPVLLFLRRALEMDKSRFCNY